MSTHNHVFTLAFSVVTPNAADQVTAKELRNALARRLRELGARQDGSDEILEACSFNEDSYTYGTADQVPALDADGSPVPRILVEVSGGVVQGISADLPTGVDLAVLDWDTEGCEEGEGGNIILDEGQGEGPQLVSLHRPKIDVEPQRLDHVFAALPDDGDRTSEPAGAQAQAQVQRPPVPRPAAEMTLRELREAGYAVALFNPEELRGADRSRLEARLAEEGNEMIDILAPLAQARPREGE